MAAERTWKGKPLADLSDEELATALEFVERCCEELHGFSPAVVWAFFAVMRSDLTIEKAKRGIFLKSPIFTEESRAEFKQRFIDPVVGE